MKKVRFDTSGSIAFHLRLGRVLSADESQTMKLEGWLLDDHLCVQKPKTPEEGWCLSLYPWGDKISAGFFSKADAIACGKEIRSLEIPWARMHEVDAISAEYVDHARKVRAILAAYEKDGLLMTIPTEEG